jgi:hypothetical protein
MMPQMTSEEEGPLALYSKSIQASQNIANNHYVGSETTIK